MLNLVNITKDYKVGDSFVHALKGVSLDFGGSEFVSVVGPSGCGKTTLLNIIGGLDKYTSGDLIINGVSTKNYKDADWDAYRNRSIGFVFQSYNLIPHQSVLANVELALTLSGVGKVERKERAMQALTRVGLREQANKRPNQLSGGQMQRVSIARALVNNPDIILADEPTGALDSVTSVQIMELLKDIANEKLIIMVTHNLDLANTYSDRIIRLLDGLEESQEILRERDGSVSCAPVSVDEDEITVATDGDATTVTISKKRKHTPAFWARKSKADNVLTRASARHTSMSFRTALTLSGKNLLTKKGRTFLTAFAGSIGIIGIALVLSLSSGFQAYIDKTQSEMLSVTPITISKQAMDIASLISSGSPLTGGEKEDPLEPGYVRPAAPDTTAVHINNITADYIQHIEGLKDPKYNADVVYDYGHSYRILSKKGGDVQMVGSMPQRKATTYRVSFDPLSDNRETLDRQFEIVAGQFPSEYNEIILVVEPDGSVNTELLYHLNWDVPANDVKAADFLGREFEIVNNNEYYSYNAGTGLFDPLATTGRAGVYGDANNIKLKVVGVCKTRLVGMMETFDSGLAYHGNLPLEYIKRNIGSDVTTAQKADLKTNVVSGSSLTAGIVATITGMGINIQSVLDTVNALDIPALSVIGEITTSNLEEVLSMFLDGDINVDTYLADQPELKQLVSQLKNMRIVSQQGVLQALGGLEIPAQIDILAKDYDSKTAITDYLNSYNAGKASADQIKYTDLVETIGDLMGTMISSISIVLIVFAGISLIVSSIMIAIITYVSVIERTKEIGVLRSLGARKKDVSRVFNCETVIIGGIAGLIGVFIAWLGTFVINAVVGAFIDLGANISTLTVWHVLIMIALSVGLTLVSGFIPSRIAAKKDPVTALRTE